MSLFTISSFLPVVIVTLIALVSARLMVRNTSINDTHEFAAIDGLRGFLALLVFIHHSVYWFNYTQTGRWFFDSSDLFSNFGLASVSLFFMITGFLFSLKLIDGRKHEIDWLRLYCSRFMRLTPLYLLLCLGVFAIVAYNSHFIVYDEAEDLISDITDWLLFVVPGHPDINKHTDTHLIAAGVIWTLPYEWYFYFMLPLLGLIIGSKSKSASSIWLILSMVCLASFTYWKLKIPICIAFAGGIIAALVVRTNWLREHLTGKGANLVAIACFIAGYSCFNENTIFARLIMLVTGFILVACGSNLFGMLTTRSARALSTISYGIYLLHGITLYVVIMLLVPQEFHTNIAIEHYWMFIFLLTPVVIAVSSLSWHFIELPAINSSSKLANWIRSLRQEKQKISTSKIKYSPFRVIPEKNRNYLLIKTGNHHD